MTWQQMPAVKDLLQIERQPAVVTVGNFDGVHLGHQYLLSKVTEQARLHEVRSLAITFEPHPIQVLRPQDPFLRIVTPELKNELIQRQGIDKVAVINFDQQFAMLSPSEFLEIVCKSTSPTALIVGEGFKFGHQRAGDGETIKLFGETHGFCGIVIDRLSNGDGIVSSSSIRQYIISGNIVAANLALSRRFVLQGVVKEGVARGRELGYPTANLHTSSTQLIPADGSYAGYASIVGDHSQVFQSMIYIGASPTFGDGERQVEAHLFDYTGDLYADELNLEFVEFVRADEKFENVTDLVARIADDERNTREILRASSPEIRSGTGKE